MESGEKFMPKWNPVKSSCPNGIRSKVHAQMESGEKFMPKGNPVKSSCPKVRVQRNPVILYVTRFVPTYVTPIFYVTPRSRNFLKFLRDSKCAMPFHVKTQVAKLQRTFTAKYDQDRHHRAQEPDQGKAKSAS